MKLYYSVGACSLTQHILLSEIGKPFSIEAVNLKDKVTESGLDFKKITEFGQVPALQFEDGTILTENIAIAQYLADTFPDKNLLAPVGQMARYKTIAWFNYVATEIHKNYGPIFRSVSKDATEAAIKTLLDKYSYVDSVLAKTPYLTGDSFTIADAYLFVTTRWSQKIPNRPAYPAIDAFMARMKDRPAVQAAMKQEGLA